MSKKVTLIPIAMVTLTKKSIYAPSSLRLSIEVDEAECISGPEILVSLALDGKSDAVMTPTYMTGKTDASGSLDLKTFGRFIKR